MGRGAEVICFVPTPFHLPSPLPSSIILCSLAAMLDLDDFNQMLSHYFGTGWVRSFPPPFLPPACPCIA